MVEPLNELLSREIKPTLQHKGAVVTLLEEQVAETGREPAAYEKSVFNFLLKHREALGIAKVERFQEHPGGWRHRLDRRPPTYRRGQVPDGLVEGVPGGVADQGLPSEA